MAEVVYRLPKLMGKKLIWTTYPRWTMLPLFYYISDIFTSFEVMMPTNQQFVTFCVFGDGMHNTHALECHWGCAMG